MVPKHSCWPAPFEILVGQHPLKGVGLDKVRKLRCHFKKLPRRVLVRKLDKVKERVHEDSVKFPVKMNVFRVICAPVEL